MQKQFAATSLSNTLLKRADLASPKTFRHVDLNLEIGEIQQINENGVRHYLTPSGIKYPSITTVMSWNSSDGIAKWRQKVGKKEADKVSLQATRKGTALHNMCENYLTNQEIIGDALPHIKDMFLTVKPILDKHVDNIHCVEKRMYSDHIGIAGTTDCVAEFDSVLSIIDFKTARKMKEEKYIQHYFMQASGYAVMYEELFGIPVPQIIIIMVSEGEKKVFIQKRNKHIHSLIELVNQYKLVHSFMENDDESN
jgi:hypothetical protein